jgi:hypothetical protein
MDDTPSLEAPMQYLCLVYLEESRMAALTPGEHAALDVASLAHDEELRSSGRLILAQALQPVDTATTVRVRGGVVSTTVGPFAETIEHLGGFVFVEARDLNEAIGIAAGLPIARIGSIEVRPVLDLEQRVRERTSA